MKYLALTSAALLVATSTIATAKPAQKGFQSYNGAGQHRVVKHRAGRINWIERVRIAQSRKRLAQLKRRIWRDGRVTRFERRQLRRAEQRHRQLVRRLRRG